MDDPCDWAKLNIEVIPGMRLEPGQGIRRRTLDNGKEQIEIVGRPMLPSEKDHRGCYGEIDDNNNFRCKGSCSGGAACMYQSEECPDGSFVEWCECELPT